MVFEPLRGLIPRPSPLASPAKFEEFFPADVRTMIKEEAIPAALEKGSWLGDSVLLRADGRDIPLRQTVSASGARYEGVEDPETVVWSKGDDFMIRLAGRDLEECRAVAPPDRRARHRGEGARHPGRVRRGDGVRGRVARARRLPGDGATVPGPVPQRTLQCRVLVVLDLEKT